MWRYFKADIAGIIFVKVSMSNRNMRNIRNRKAIPPYLFFLSVYICK